MAWTSSWCLISAQLLQRCPGQSSRGTEAKIWWRARDHSGRAGVETGSRTEAKGQGHAGYEERTAARQAGGAWAERRGAEAINRGKGCGAAARPAGESAAVAGLRLARRIGGERRRARPGERGDRGAAVPTRGWVSVRPAGGPFTQRLPVSDMESPKLKMALNFWPETATNMADATANATTTRAAIVAKV